MPEYEYRCSEGHTFTVKQRMSETGKAVCPDHELETTDKVFTVPAVLGLANTEQRQRKLPPVDPIMFPGEYLTK